MQHKIRHAHSYAMTIKLFLIKYLVALNTLPSDFSHSLGILKPNPDATRTLLVKLLTSSRACLDNFKISHHFNVERYFFYYRRNNNVPPFKCSNTLKKAWSWRKKHHPVNCSIENVSKGSGLCPNLILLL